MHIPIIAYFSIIYITFVQSNIVLNVENQCKASTKKMSELLSNVSSCLMMNYGPRSTCLSCVNSYREFMDEKTNFLIIKSVNEMNCFHAIEKYDKYKLVNRLISNISHVWNNSNCQFCFSNSSTIVYKSNVENFMKKHKILMNCLQSYTNSDISLCDSTDFPFKNISFNMSVCRDCSTKYDDLLRYYVELRKDNKSEVCGDVENLLLCSRTAYENYFQCPLMSPGFMHLWPIIAICAATLLFYSCSTICHDTNQIQIYSQKRVVACFGPESNSLFGASLNSQANNQLLRTIPSNPTYESDYDDMSNNHSHNTHSRTIQSSIYLSVPTGNHNNQSLLIQN